MRREKGMVKKERERERRCETKRAESAGENGVECVGRRKEMRVNVIEALSS